MCLPTFEIRPLDNPLGILPEYDWDYVKKNPGLYRGADDDKSAVLNITELGLFCGSGSFFTTTPTMQDFILIRNPSGFDKLKYHKINNSKVDLGNYCLRVTASIDPPPKVDFKDMPYGTVIRFDDHARGMIYGVVSYNSAAPNQRQVVSLLNPLDTWTYLPIPYEAVGTLILEKE